MLCCYRPVAWPVWNPDHRRLVRFWTARHGIDDPTVEALRARRIVELAVVESTEDQLTAQLHEELAVSRHHLRAVLDGFWDPNWRRDHKGHDESPEDHLWRAATAITTSSTRSTTPDPESTATLAHGGLPPIGRCTGADTCAVRRLRDWCSGRMLWMPSTARRDSPGAVAPNVGRGG
jgi:hypothetical protein